MEQQKAIDVFKIFAGRVPSQLCLMWHPDEEDYSVTVLDEGMDAVSMSVLFTTSQHEGVGLTLADGRLVFR